MTILITESVVEYIGDGVQITFPVNYRFFTDTNLMVYLDGVLQTYVTDYSVSNSGEETGSSVTFIVPPPAPDAENSGIVTIERLLSNQQLLDLIAFDRFPAESVEAGLDYIVLLVQQNTDAINRSVSTAIGSDIEGLTAPPYVPSEFWLWDDATQTIVTTSINELGEQVIPTMTDGEIIAGTGTQTRLISASQTKLAVTTHETDPVASVFDSLYHEVVDVLPATPDPNKIYLVRN